MRGRGQVTIFVIIAVLIVVTVILFFVFREKISGEKPLDVNVAPAYDYVINCLEETGNNAIKDVGEKGGYALVIDDVDFVEQVPHYLIGERKLIPSVEGIEAEISFIVMNELSYCILNFNNLDDDYDEINHELRNVKTTILENAVVIELDYPIRINKKESTYEISEFSFNFKSRLYDYYLISEEIVNEQQGHPGSFCVSCLYDIGEEYDVNVDMYDYGNSTVFSIIDEEYKINDEVYEWRFAIK